jgi:hypothetical protein
VFGLLARLSFDRCQAMMRRSNANIDGDVMQQRSEPYSSLMKRYGGTGRVRRRHAFEDPAGEVVFRAVAWQPSGQDTRRSIPKAAPCAPE